MLFVTPLKSSKNQNLDTWQKFIDNKFTKYIYTPSSGRLQMQPKDLRQDNLCTAIIIDIGVIVRSRSGINIGEV